MTHDVALMIASKLKQSAEALNDIVDIAHRELGQQERWPIFQAIGEIYAIQYDQIRSRIVAEHPELKSMLFPAFDDSSDGE